MISRDTDVEGLSGSEMSDASSCKIYIKLRRYIEHRIS